MRSPTWGWEGWNEQLRWDEDASQQMDLEQKENSLAADWVLSLL